MPNSGRLAEKVAVITGASSGIGRAVALLFAREGAKVALGARREDRLEELIREITREGGIAISRKTNVASEEEVRLLMDAALGAFGQIDILINNAGVAGGLSGLPDQNSDEWLEVYRTNVLGTMFGTKHVAKHMMERRSGAIVNVASVAGVRSGAGGNAYSASKAAIINFTMTSACDLGGYNVRVNAVCPGLVETEMTKPVFDYARAKGKEEKLGSRCELRRYGVPMEVAYAILFLASDEASFITGQALPVDGGNTASLNLPGMKF
jgi:meso-butanediol dehydrogenase / (S,S)-butanediol dehydrogenase / diacetyl reductase